MCPNSEFFSNDEPTVPIINIGPHVEQKLHILNASFCDISSFWYRSAIKLTPIGYPESTLIKKIGSDEEGQFHSL